MQDKFIFILTSIFMLLYSIVLFESLKQMMHVNPRHVFWRGSASLKAFVLVYFHWSKTFPVFRILFVYVLCVAKYLVKVTK